MNEEIWRESLARLREIAARAGVSEKRGRLPPALTFAEGLILCPTDDAARALLQRDREAAASFLDVASAVAAMLDRGEIGWLQCDAPELCPFFHPAVMVQEFLESLQAECPESWE